MHDSRAMLVHRYRFRGKKKVICERKHVVVTGGGTGIGHAIAVCLAREGASVYVCDIDSEATAALHDPAAGMHARQADVSSETDVEAFFRYVLECSGGVLDALVNNAGISGPTGPLETMPYEEWRRTFEINVHSAFLALRQAIPVMKSAGQGSIVNISSTAGIMGYPLRTPYAAAKWGIIGITKSLAMELGPDGIRVNAICPGSVDGARMDRIIANEARVRQVEETVVREGYVRQVSMRTFMDADDIAEAVTFLCSDRARRISGQALSVDGHNETLTTVEF